jgi:bifunctional DNA-binding transcriptional regulator/antitoxin component of YhaV-PrlF toxin-antitoxin module
METMRIDHEGRLILPEDVRRALGVGPDQDVVAEITAAGLLIRAIREATSITERIAAMNLPTADWEQMEREIESGRLA